MLVEVLISLGIVSIGVLGVVALLGRTAHTGADSRDSGEVVQLWDFVRHEIEKLSPDTLSSEISENSRPWYCYRYTADLTTTREDGTAEPARGEGVRLMMGFRRAADPLFTDDLATSRGAIFRIRLMPPENGDINSEGEDREPERLPWTDLFVEFYRDPQPGVNESEWNPEARVLRMPMRCLR